MKLLKNIASFGPAMLIAGYVYYSIKNVWNVPIQIVIYTGAALTLLLLFFSLGKIKSAFKRRSTQYGTNSLVMTLVVLGILGMINFIGKKHHKRMDLTSAKLYSLSDQSKKVVQGLKGEVKILYFDREPNQTLNDLMEEYRGVNASKVNFKTIDPQKDPGQAKQYNISRFKETVVAYGAKTEKVETPQEESITNAILKVTRDKNKVIYFLQGHNEGDISDTQEAKGYAVAKKAIENQNYEVKTLSLAQNPAIPDDCAVLVIAGPKVGLLPTEIPVVDKYVDVGGKVLLLQDPDTTSGLEELLKKWKIGLENDTVVDASGIGQLLGMGPAAPLVTSFESHAITKDLSRTMTFFPLARSVKTVENPSSSFSSSVLFKTSEASWGEKNLKGGSVRFDEGTDTKGPVPLGIVSTKTVSGDEKEKKHGKEARVVVVGDSDFASNSYFQQQRNGDVFLNAVSWLAEDEDLISVRPKSQENRSISLTRANSSVLFWMTMVLLPGSALISGILVWLRRR
jgi:gliding motility-associatede transport system auxiliary component